jgi:hypothetical protein
MQFLPDGKWPSHLFGTLVAGWFEAEWAAAAGYASLSPLTHRVPS